MSCSMARASILTMAELISSFEISLCRKGVSLLYLKFGVVDPIVFPLELSDVFGYLCRLLIYVVLLIQGRGGLAWLPSLRSLHESPTINDPPRTDRVCFYPLEDTLRSNECV